MSEVVIEQLSTPENSALREVKSLHNIFWEANGMDAVMADACRMSNEVFARVRGTRLNPAEQHAINLMQESYDYAAYASPGDPLPDSLVITTNGRKDSGSEVTLALEARASLPLYNNIENFFRDILVPSGLGVVADFVQTELQEKKADTLISLKEWVKQLPEYQFLESFAASEPRYSREQPLNQFWRNIRERQIEDEVQTRFALTPGQAIEIEPQAVQVLKRALYQLDEETNPAPSVQATQPLDKLRQWFDQEIERQIEQRRGWEDEDLEVGETTMYPREPWTINKSQSGSLKIRFADTEDEHYVGEIFEFDEHINTHRRHDVFMVSEELLLKEALDLIYLEREQLTSYQDFLDSVAERYAQVVFDSALERANDVFVCCNWYQLSLSASRKLPLGQVYNSREYTRAEYDLESNYIIHNQRERLRMSTYSNSISLTPYETLQREMEKTFAQVLQKPATNDTHTRIIEAGSIYLDGIAPVRIGDSEQLIVAFEGDIYSGLPLIPGYDIVGYTPAIYPKQPVVAYRRAEHDPYQIPIIQLPIEASRLLKVAYAGLGLEELAQLIADREETLTVADLANIIRKTSKYHYPEPDDGLEHRLQSNSLQDFRSVIKLGKLHVQCDGANDFLRKSLDVAFGNGSTKPVLGRVFQPGHDRVNNVLHAQAIFSHGGKPYILDATPASGVLQPQAFRLSDDWSSRTESLDRGSPELSELSPDKPAESYSSDKNLVQQPQPLDKTKLEAVQQPHSVELVIGRLESNLKIILGAHNQTELYKNALKLSAHHPYRKALGLASKIASSKEVDQTEFAEAQQYFELVDRADPAVRRRLGVDSIDSRQLRFLGAIITELSNLTR